MDVGLKTFNVGTEYILTYARSSKFMFNPVFKHASDERQKKGYWKGFWNAADRPTMRYDILGFTPLSGQWKWNKELAMNAVANYQLYCKKFKDTMSLEEYWDKTGRTLKFIRRNPEGKGKNAGVENWIPPTDKILRNSNWTDILSSKLTEFTQGIFDAPKNVNLIKLLLQAASLPKDDIILDFFSGSATTAHAVMQLNAEDGGHRKFIMVQLPEVCDAKSEAYKAGYRTICDIGEERIRRAGEKIRQEHPDVELDTGFRVFRVDSTNMEDVYYSAGDYAQEALAGLTSNIKPDRSALDVFFGCVLDWGLPLDRPYETEEIAGYAVHNYDHGALLACFADAVSEELVRAMAQRQPLRAVFRDINFPDSPAKINAEEIFKMYSPLTKIKVI